MRKRSVLTVDDEYQIRKIIKKQLENSVDKVYEAENGDAALKVLENHDVDVAIIDQNMPGTLGLDLIDIINSKHPDVLCIMLTGNGDLEMAKEAIKLKVFDFIEKPFQRDTLVERVIEGIKFRDESLNKLSKEQDQLVGALKKKNVELNCIYNFSRILDSDELTEKEKYEEIAKALPFGFSNPDELNVKLTIDENNFTSRNFSDSQNCISETIILADTAVGKLEAFYTNAANTFTEGEKNLLKTVGKGLENKLAATRFKKTLENIRAKNQKDQKEIEEKNVAIKVILEKIDEEKNQVKENVALNIEGNIKPLLKKLKREKDLGSNSKHLEIIEQFLNDINHDFYKNTANLHMNLSPSEIRVCHLVKSGLVNKEVADMLNISLNTVKNHIRSIRKKLGLTNTKESLINYFNSLSTDC